MTQFGINQIGKDTPQWAKNMFRIYFFASKAFIGYAAATTLFSKDTLNEMILLITLFIDPIVYGFSKMFGIGANEEDIKPNTLPNYEAPPPPPPPVGN